MYGLFSLPSAETLSFGVPFKLHRPSRETILGGAVGMISSFRVKFHPVMVNVFFIFTFTFLPYYIIHVLS